MFLVNILAFWLFSSALALINVTIDDTNGDPNTGAKIAYYPLGDWTLGPTCSTCSAKANASLAYQNTWRDTSYIPPEDPLKAEISFIGSAVHVYGILGHGNPAWLATDVSFLIDGQELDNYSQPLDNETGWTYNHLFFSRSNLTFDNHTLTMLLGARQGSNISIFMLDYIIYETDLERAAAINAANSSQSHRSKTPLIVGIVLGVLAAVGLIIASVYFFVFRRRRQHSGPRWGTSVATPAPVNTEMGFHSLQSFDSRAPSISRLTRMPSAIVTLSGSDQSISSLPTTTTTVTSGSRKGQRQSTAVPSAGSQGRMVDAAVTLAAEVRRLRDENDRLRDAGSSRPSYVADNAEEAPPPYLHPQ